MFNPTTFVPHPEGMAAIRRRDRWIRSTVPLFQERIEPAAHPNELDSERLEIQRVFMDGSNRLAGAIDTLAVGDGEAGLAHISDTFFVLVY
jgi:hypothetical protein